MTQKFLKKEDLQLINGGYLSDKEGTPWIHSGFIALQKRAEFLVLFAEKASTKDFKGKKADCIEAVKAEVANSLSKEAKVTFFHKRASQETKLLDELTKEATSWLSSKEENSDIDALNDFMQEFNLLAEFENFGLFFEPGIQKLNRIYTVEEVKEAVLSLKGII